MDKETEQILIEHVKPLRDFLVERYGFGHRMIITPAKFEIHELNDVYPFEIVFGDQTTPSKFIENLLS